MSIFPKKLTHRSSLLALASSLAIAPVPALAQSFDGFGEVFAGSAMISETPDNTTVIVSAGPVIIDWTPNDAAINAGVPIQFQAQGTTATFVDGNGTDYAVLNRIVATDLSRPIVFDGNVVSQVQGNTGGTVFFYSPSGIIVGSNAAFDVGRLGLTTSDIADQGFGDWIVSDMVDFAGAPVSDSQITIEAGATISALEESSYVALFAPSIQQDGLIEVNGQAAFVAASAGIMRFSPDGLFDIEVFVGSEATGGVGISHGGVTTGPQSSGPFDSHRIYMVSVARNTALSIALGDNSELGFDIAGAANVDGNAVVLSAGASVIMGQSGGFPVDPGTNIIEITSAVGTSNQFTSSVSASSTDSILVSGAGTFDFAGDTLLDANDLTISGAVNVMGILDVNAVNDISAIGSINADIAVLFSAGNLTLDMVDTLSDAVLTSGGLLDVAAVQSVGGNILLDGMTGINAGFLDAAANIDVMSAGAVTIAGPANAGGAINIAAGTTLDLIEMVDAGTDLMLAGNGITATALSAGNNLDVSSAADATLNGPVIAGANANITGNIINAQDISANANLTIVGQDIVAGGLGAGGILDVNATNDISTFGPINADSVMLTSGGNVTLDTVDTVGDASLTAGGLLDVAAVQSAGGNILLDGMAGVNAGLLDAAGNIDVMSPGAVMVTGPTNSGGAIGIAAGTTLDLIEMVDAGTDLMLTGNGITAAALSAGNNLDISSAGDAALNGPAAAGANANITAQNITAQDISATGNLTIMGQDIAAGALGAGGILDVNAANSLSTIGAINADSATLMSGGDLDLVTVDTVNDVSLTAGGQLNVDMVRATAGSIALDGMLGVNAGQLDAGGSLNVTSAQAIMIAGTADAGGALDFTAGTTLDLVGAATAGTDLMLVGNGITANAVNAGNSLSILSTADITLNGDTDAGTIATVTGGNVAAQNITTNGDLTVMAQGDLAITGGANSQSALSLAAVQSLDVGSASAVAAATLNATGNLRAGTVDAGTIAAESQSSVTIAGTWTASDIVITAPQAMFEAMGSLSAAANGNVSLFSTNTEGTFVGSFAAPPNMGFVLDADGFSRISAGSLAISATDLLGDGIDLAIGDLDLGSIADLQNLTLGVAAGGDGGRVQLAGNLVATGNGAPIDVTISANLFELDTDTGSVALLSGGNSAGGFLNIAADNIHIASTDLLDQLRIDPFFDGFADALAAPAANSQPDGVLSADGLALTVGSTLYIQNTGTDELPAGFVATLEGLNVIPDGQGDRPTVVINGAINTPDGQLVGEDATTALIEKLGGTDQFSEDSQFNSCLLNSCQGATPVQDEEISAIVTSVVRAVNEDATIDGGTGTAADGTIDVATAIDTSGDADADINGAGDTSTDDDFDLGDPGDGESSGDEESSEKDSEEEADEKDEQEESEGAATGPIAPPVSIISTGSLAQTGEINEAIASSGNPSLTDPEAGMANPDGDIE